ncbi:hopanoid biosynthesis-associated protein HpnK [Steroidobacter cummioxidans]|uniref:hopanoid biosynthesis-associated protein HpnK n=1 Tax=Steroidobacter cummioxidans TaxID=1803913 RepID=UPI000E318A7F|nr:hopanoid biosynthesis-associated protein HpnK [Steroidobacter cummioxidans]
MLFVTDDSRTVRAARTRRDFLIITADDFGERESVNEAVELAARRGVLTAASLMVSGSAAADAVRRAQRLPQLRVGLHIVLVDGSAILERAQIPLLVDASGRFGKRMVIDAFRFAFSPTMRRQLSCEIRAQFKAFAATGLQLDHVNAHKHFHVHPTLLRIILDVGREFGMQAIRWPREPLLAYEHSSGISQAMQHAGLSPWLTLMRRQIERAGLLHNDWMFGMVASGQMDTRALLRILQHLPSGITEIYSHPGSEDSQRELAALTSRRVQAILRSAFVARGGYSDALHRRQWMRT